MAGLLQWLAVLALGAVVAFIVRRWEAFIGDTDIAFLIGFPALCLIAFIYDRRQARLQKSNRATIEPD
jgi:hypothetical protein